MSQTKKTQEPKIIPEEQGHAMTLNDLQNRILDTREQLITMIEEEHFLRHGPIYSMIRQHYGDGLIDVLAPRHIQRHCSDRSPDAAYDKGTGPCTRCVLLLIAGGETLPHGRTLRITVENDDATTNLAKKEREED